MGLILDTGILIEGERGAGKPIDFGRWAQYGEAFICAITVSELLVGVHMAESEKRRLRRSAYIEGLLARLPVLDFTVEVARVHSRIFASLMKKGRMVGAHDLMITATALACGHAVMTLNESDFRSVPGLNVLAP